MVSTYICHILSIYIAYNTSSIYIYIQIYENRLVNLEKNLKNAKARVANKMVQILKINTLIALQIYILAKIVIYRKEFSNLTLQCAYIYIFSQYKDRDCMKVNTKNKKICARLHQRLDHNNPASLCPVDAAKGSCGVPVHMDLFSEKQVA